MTATSLSAAGAAAALEKYEPVIGLEVLRRTRGLREFLISISSVAIREGRYASFSLWMMALTGFSSSPVLIDRWVQEPFASANPDEQPAAHADGLLMPPSKAVVVGGF
jgi:hypothetical protein